MQTLGANQCQDSNPMWQDLILPQQGPDLVISDRYNLEEETSMELCYFNY